jgi:phage baseplate assembly protein V
MMQHLLNAMRFQAGIGQNLIAQVRIGIINSYNKEDGTIKATVQPVESDESGEGQTGWIPLVTGFIGQVGAPVPGEQVIIIFQEGSLNNGIAIGRIYSSEDVPPPVPSGEWWLTHPSGSFIKVKNNGDVEIKAAQKIIITSESDAQINVTGDINVTATGNANVSAQNIELANGGTALELVNSLFESKYNAHTHGATPPPDTPYQMTSAELTSVLKAQ